MATKFDELTENPDLSVEIKKTTRRKKTTKTKKASKTSKKSSASKTKKAKTVVKSTTTVVQEKPKRIIRPPKQIQDMLKEKAAKKTNPTTDKANKKRTLHLNINFAREDNKDVEKENEFAAVVEPVKEEPKIVAISNQIKKEVENNNVRINPEKISAKNVIKEFPIEDKKEISKDITKEVAKEVLKEIQKEFSKGASKKENKEVHKEAAKSPITIQPTNRIIDTSVNQNSAFFYEPSVFERFNLKITDINDTKQEITIDEQPSTEKSVLLEVNDNKVSSKNVSKDSTDNLDDMVFYTDNTSEIINKEIEKSQNNNNYENSVSDELIDNIGENDLIDLIELSANNEGNNIEETQNSNIPNNDMALSSIKNYVSSKLDELFIDRDFDDSEIPDYEDSVVPSISEISSNKIEGNNNFFDSSIPPIQEHTPIRTIKKVKKSISPIFKSFSFEEAKIAKATETLDKIEIPAEPIINIAEPSIIETNVVADAQNIDTIIPDIDVSAEPVRVKTPIIETQQETVSTEKQEDVTIVTNTSKNVITLDDEKIDELLEKETETESTENNDVDEKEPELSDEEILNSEIDNELLDKLIEESNEETEDSLDEDDYDYEKIKQIQQEENNNSSYDDDKFSIESYFGLDKLTDEDIKDLKNDSNTQDVKIITDEEKKAPKKQKKEDYEFSAIKNLIEGVNSTINNLSDKISALESENKSPIYQTITYVPVQTSDKNVESVEKQINEPVAEEVPEEVKTEEATIIDRNDAISDEDLLDLLMNEEPSVENSDEPAKTDDHDEKTVEDLLTDALLSNDNSINDDLKNSLLSEVLSTDGADVSTAEDEKIDSDFTKVLDCLTKAIEELEQENTPQKDNTDEESISEELDDDSPLISDYDSKDTNSLDDQVFDESSLVDQILEDDDLTEQIIQEPNIVEQTITPTQSYMPKELNSSDNNDGKSFNILIDKDDIFSIQILNETYEIVADFGGISILSENVHISTPKNNFYVKIGDKYIEIHHNIDNFKVLTNFEDIEFANAISNIGFIKKPNQIELNIKEAFKLSSVNNKIELSMLNKTIASIKDTPVTQIDESSICDNRTLLISEETQKVYLPYTIAEVMNILKYNDKYENLQEVVDNEFTVPLSTFKMPIISRFREAYRFMRTKEKSSVYAAIDLAVELMFNSNLNPAVIRAAKDLKELNIYLDCLYENEVDKFDCFKIIYKVLPKIK